MKTVKPLLFLTLALLLSLPAWAATRYGEATVQSGKLTVLREGRRMVFRKPNEKVQINHSDVIRVGRRSKVLLETVEKATLTLGSNAVLHVEPWKRAEKKGLMRMMFGRFRASVTGLTGGQRFNVRTATATIGVKGTELTALQTANERTVLWVENSNSKAPVALEGLDGVEKDVEVGFASAVVGNTPASNPARATPELQAELQTLDSPDPGSPAAAELPPAVQEAGIASGGDDDQGGGDAGEGDEGDDEDAAGAADNAAVDAAQDQAAAAQQAATDAAVEPVRKTIGVDWEN